MEATLLPAPEYGELAEGRDAGYGVAEDEGVDLVGALVRPHALQVVGVAHDGIVERHAVAAEYGARFARDLDRLADVVELAEGDLLRPQRPFVFLAPEVQRQERALLDLEHHFDELLLGELEARNGLAE